MVERHGMRPLRGREGGGGKNLVAKLSLNVAKTICRWPLNAKGVTLYKKYALLHRMLNERFETSISFFKECTFYQLLQFFFSYGNISVWVDICILNMFCY